MNRTALATVYVLLLAVLAVSVWYARTGNDALRAAQAQRYALQQQVSEAQRLLERLKVKREYQHRAMALLAEAEKAGFTASAWSRRRVELARREVPRSRTNELLGTLGAGPYALFSPLSYEISVRTPEESLFRVPAHANASVNLSLSGTEYLKLEGEK